MKLFIPSTTKSTSLSFLSQTILLLKRSYLTYIREPINTLVRGIINLLLSLFIGLLFINTSNNQSSIYSRVGFIFFIICMQALVTIVNSVLTCKYYILYLINCNIIFR